MCRWGKTYLPFLEKTHGVTLYTKVLLSLLYLPDVELFTLTVHLEYTNEKDYGPSPMDLGTTETFLVYGVSKRRLRPLSPRERMRTL